MAYIGLGAVPVTAALTDPSGRNTGNWTAVMGPTQMAIKQSRFELYHLSVKDGPVGSTLSVYVDNNFYDITPNGNVNSWDPNQALELTPGQSIYFYWDKSIGTTPPTVVGYFRYDVITAGL